MTLTIDLTPELQERLSREAAEQGVAVEKYALELLDRSLPPKERFADLASCLQSWIDQGDAEEQRETGDFLIRTLDEDRLSDRKLFPPELKGVTW